MRLAVLLLAGAALGSAADQTAQNLFDRVRDKVLDNTRRVPRYTCTQTIDRTAYQPQYERGPARCEAVIAARGQLGWEQYLTERDRLRLDVAVLDGKETFAWAGARQFETSDIAKLISSGSTGSGDFAAFLSSIFNVGTTRFSLLREEKSPTDLLATFGFTVPAGQSHYLVRSRRGEPERAVGFHGTFLVDEALAELKRLTVEVDQIPGEQQVCRIQDVIDYHRLKIGDGDFLLPETSKMTVLFNTGGESRNETHYSDCREYAAESTISFGDDPASSQSSTDATAVASGKLPPHLRLQIGLKTTIHSQTAAAGDAIDGVLLGDVKDSESRIVAHANDIVHGRILRIEQHVIPFGQWVVALRFDTIEHNGIGKPIELRPVYDMIGAMQSAILTKPPSEDSGVFVFGDRRNLVLDQKFHSEWETR